MRWYETRAWHFVARTIASVAIGLLVHNHYYGLAATVFAFYTIQMMSDN